MGARYRAQEQERVRDMRAFRWVLLLQVCCFCCGLILSVSVWEEPVRESQCGWVGLGVVLCACILQRLLLAFSPQRGFSAAAGLLLVIYTVGLTLMGSQAAVWLFAGGQAAIYMGCAALVLSFVWGGRAGGSPQEMVTKSTLIILLLAGTVTVTLDNQEWDWRFAYAVLFAIVGSTYLNLVPVWVGEEEEESVLQLRKCTLIILQPLLFVEVWALECIVAS
jgi:hypothetical protein